MHNPIKPLFLLVLLLGTSGPFTTWCQDPAPAPKALHIFAFGDWGAGSSDQLAVAEAIKEHCQSQTCDFGLLLGDNFYPRGVKSVEDPKWEQYFEKVYQGLNLPFYVALGNHDHKGNEQAQIDYTAQQKRWTLPAAQYRRSFPKGAAQPLLELFVIDSEDFKDEHAARLKEDLQKSNATWKILALHDPIYSNGKHGDSKYLKKKLVPIICQEIDLVLSGHDHILSHLDDPYDGCGFQQVVAGTGGKSIYDYKADPRAPFTDSAFGFVSLKVRPKELLIQFHKTDGKSPYRFKLTK